MGRFAPLNTITALVFSAVSAMAQQAPADDFPTNPAHGLQGCTADGTSATFVFKFDMDSMYLHGLQLEGYRKLQDELKAKVTKDLLPQWNDIVSKHSATDMREGKSFPELEMYRNIYNSLARYGVTEEGTQNVWATIEDAWLKPGKGICPNAPAATI